MKTIALIAACTLFGIGPAHAGAIKDVHAKAQDEIAHYYLAGGEWELIKVSKMNFLYEESVEFITVSARTTLQGITNGRLATENCLVTFIEDNLELHAINCF